MTGAKGQGGAVDIINGRSVSQMVTYLFVIEKLGSFNKSKA